MSKDLDLLLVPESPFCGVSDLFEIYCAEILLHPGLPYLLAEAAGLFRVRLRPEKTSAGHDCRRGRPP